MHQKRPAESYLLHKNNLTFERPDHNSFCKILLQERVNNKHWCRRNNDDAVLELFRLPLSFRHGLSIIHHICGLTNQKQVSQNNLQWHFLGINQVDQSIKVTVPFGCPIEKCQNCNNCWREREHNAKKVAEIPTSINTCSFQKLLGNGILKECSAYNQVHNIDRTRQNHHPKRIVDMQILYQDVTGDQASGEEHGKAEQQCEKIVPKHVFSRQGIRSE